ncbi:hypothetical protein QDY71_03260 [Kingella negevensis]|uniref:hypothetical protein n=1 Tax=Kingella negevensis TaxID=1522312 RepID=UPI00254E224D|nr:hypothetical protein [Kingella negevensis]MDK4696794.1 hypothetical protein [Kingella negevensis]MDK4709497.1 hypothetical protein [Kingella negevensis]
MPTRLQNLELNLRKYVLQDLLAEKDEEECERIIHSVINKLSDEDLLLKIQRFVLNEKPTDFADFQAAVQQRAQALCLQVNDSDIQKFTRYLREQDLIRQNNGKIEYAPFITQPEKTQFDDKLQKVLAALAVAKNKRPTKLKALQNVIKSHAQYGDKEAERMVQYLQEKKYIQIDGTSVVYKK